MFRHVSHENTTITIYVNGRPFPANDGDSVAAILLKQGITAVHAASDGAARGPYCMMGVCFDCMITCEDGRIEQACQTYVKDGMKVYLPLKVQKPEGINE